MFAVHTVIDHCAALQIGNVPVTPSSHPNAGLVHVDIVLDTTSHHAGAAVNTACCVEEIRVINEFQP
ncbi:hypothetical protein [Candidatus Villigracilis vicinus]|uniref:hypothetical protein n=1 Tax=Candidatus Villigracilis vicinus TaxID=3140679 RepID=UPI0031E6B671